MYPRSPSRCSEWYALGWDVYYGWVAETSYLAQSTPWSREQLNGLTAVSGLTETAADEVSNRRFNKSTITQVEKPGANMKCRDDYKCDTWGTEKLSQWRCRSSRAFHKSMPWSLFKKFCPILEVLLYYHIMVRYNLCDFHFARISTVQ